LDIGAVELDSQGMILGGPTPFVSTSSSGFGTAAVAAASHRFAIALPIINPNVLRVIQRCE
jgi:hypothetical protein